MKTMYVGTYTENQAFGLEGNTKHIQVYLHRLDPNTYLLGDDADGLCFADVLIPAKIGEKVMQGDFEALAEARADIASIINRPHFKFAHSCEIIDTDPSILHAEQYRKWLQAKAGH